MPKAARAKALPREFLGQDFLLSTETSRWLYHEVAADLPLYDYHGHLRPDHLVGNHRFEHLTEIWLASDHYKWRAMRGAGVDESLITGAADPYEKFLAWARTVPQTLRNPLYHWTHLELRRYFNIDLLLSEGTAKEVWAEANRQLATLDTHAILKRFRVALVGTTDDPLDDLRYHEKPIVGLETRVYPTFRPDQLMAIDRRSQYWEYLEQLGRVYCTKIDSVASLLQVIAKAHARFDQLGARISDHAIWRFPEVECGDEQAEHIFARARRGEVITQVGRDRFAIYILQFIARLNAKANWVQQFHIGGSRNVNSRMTRQLGSDAGCDAIGDGCHEPGLRQFLDSLDSDGQLAKTILYNLNPAENYVFAALAGSFQQGPVRCKIQWGSAWWFLDQLDGMRWQIDALSRVGLLGGFIGMVTDSRSMMSFPRHEYFRRLLCSIIGSEVEQGEIPKDRELLADLVRDVCFRNAVAYFGLELSPTFA